MAKSEGRDRGTMYITDHSTVNVQKYFSTSELTEEHQKKMVATDFRKVAIKLLINNVIIRQNFPNLKK